MVRPISMLIGWEYRPPDPQADGGKNPVENRDTEENRGEEKTPEQESV